MLKKLRNSYHNASVWAHHHTAVLVFGLTVLAAVFGRQFGSYFMGEAKTHASYDPTMQIAWCDTHEQDYTVDISECYALAHIYAQLDGDNRMVSVDINSHPWFQWSTDIDNWAGITLGGATTFVEELRLNIGNSALGEGQIVNFSGLPNLKRLWFWGSAIHGIDISNNLELTNLEFRYHTNVTTINVSNNIALELLDVEGNDLDSIDVTNLVNLKHLALSFNRITVVDVSNNPLLEYLGNRGGSRYGYPMNSIDLSNNPNLKNLQLYSQNIDYIDISNKPLLEYVHVANNNISGPIDLSSSPNISFISFASNKITDITLPAGASNVNTIDASNNKLTSIDLSPIVNSANILHTLQLQNNQIASLGTNFDSFTNLGFMMMMDLDDGLNGNCLDPETLSPAYIAFLDSKFANRSFNQTCGRDVPEEEYNALVDLYNATDGDNWIRNDGWLDGYSVCSWENVGCISIGNQQHVAYLWLNNNNLQGTIPASFNNLQKLQYLSFDSWVNDRGIAEDKNNINIDLSVFFGMNDLSNMGLFYSINEVYGTLHDLGPLPSLEYIRLDGVPIGGTIPSFFSTMTNLREIDLEDTNIHGTIPDLTALIRLEKLDLRNTNVSGPLPEFATQYPAGTTPANMVMESPLVEIMINGTRLDGTIPASWSQLTNLERLGIGGKGGSGKYISGQLPASRGSLTNLTELMVMFTNITGELPTSRGNLVNLERFNIIFNSITGELPAERENLAPDNLLIMGNHLEGPIPSWITNAQNYLIQNNCFDIENIDPDIEQQLIQSESRGHKWRVQNNCLSTVETIKTLSTNNPLPGQTFTLTIGYKNFGPQRAPRFTVSEKLDEDIMLISSLPPENQAIINKEFGTQDDMCYADMLAEGTGPYADYMLDFISMLLFQEAEGDFELPEGMTNTQFFDMLFASIMFGIEDMEEVDPAELADAITQYQNLWEDPNLGSAGVVSAAICDFIQNGGVNINNPVSLKNIYNEIGGVCLPLLGFDYREHQDQCGAGGEEGYRRQFPNLQPDEEGEIVLTLQLVAGLSAGSEHDAITYLLADGAIMGDTIIPVTITAGGSNPTTPTNPVTPTNPTQPSPGPTPTQPSHPAAEEEKQEEAAEDNTNDTKPSIDIKQYLPSLEEIQHEVAKLPNGISVDLEKIEAFLMAQKIGMTTKPDYMSFNPEEYLNRSAAAKYFVEYVEKVLGWEADESRRVICSQFDDTAYLQKLDLYEFITRACMHNIMGLDQGVSVLSSFMPAKNLERSELAAIVSRTLDGTHYDNTNGQYETRYQGHISNLENRNLITNLDPTLEERRVYPLLMILRRLKQEVE